MYVALKKKSLALNQNIFKIYLATRKPTTIYYIFERKITFLKNTLTPEGGIWRFSHTNVAWHAQIPVGLQHGRLLLWVRIGRSIRKGFPCRHSACRSSCFSALWIWSLQGFCSSTVCNGLAYVHGQPALEWRLSVPAWPPQTLGYFTLLTEEKLDKEKGGQSAVQRYRRLVQNASLLLWPFTISGAASSSCLGVILL